MYKNIILGILIALLSTSCVKRPTKEETKELIPKKEPIPKNMEGITTSTTISEGSVYASQKDNYLTSCLDGNGQGCRDISTLYEQGFGVPKNMQKSLYYLKKGCELNNGASCNRAGNFYASGYSGVIDKQKSSAYYNKGCTLNYSTACNNIGNAYMNGIGVVKNLNLAEIYLTKALNLGENSYNNLGFLFQMKDEDIKAETYYIKGCDLKSSSGCRNLALLYKSQKKYTKAYNKFVKACNLAKGMACQEASNMIYNKLLQVSTPNKTMFSLDSKSCKLNDKVGCSDLGYDYEKGIGTSTNIKKAKKYYKKACKLGHQASCKAVKRIK